MAVTTVHCLLHTSPASLSFSTDKNHHCNFFKPFSVSKLNSPSVRVYSSKFSRVEPVISRREFKVLGLVDDDSRTVPAETESDTSEEGATIDLKLPRRRMLVQFTCNVCGERTNRLINRLAYERGVVFVQCAGCLQHHKLVDNLGLITEYDFREKTNTGTEVDQD